MPDDTLNDTPKSKPFSALKPAVMEDLRAFFDHSHHHPSKAHWEALEQVVDCMENMANGTCEPWVFLSPIDPGVGKTSAVVAFAASLVESQDHRDTGMIVCVGRIEEARSLADALKVRSPDVTLAVLVNQVSGSEVSALSTMEDSNEAQILITTQQRIELVTRDRTFAESASFFYRGRPRAVRVWDEAWLPGVTITASRHEIFAIIGEVNRDSPPCAEALEEFAALLKTTQDGELIEVPDFEADHGVSFRSMMAHVAADNQKRTFAALAVLSGQAARVLSEGTGGQRAISYENTIPEDLKPLLVLDASGRVRETYRLIEEQRKDLIRLKAAVKDYSPLTVHLWDRSGSKSGWSDKANSDVMIKAIRETILERPDEEWLIVAHKARRGSVSDVERKVIRGLPLEIRKRVRVITWGRHMATNEFAEVPNVILAGTLFMPNSHLTALAHLSANQPTATSLVTTAEVAQVERGEHAHLILQAVCRSKVRKSDGGRCHAANAYVIAHKSSGIANLINDVFPQCTVKRWREEVAPTPKAVARAIKYLSARRDQGCASVTTTELRKALRMPNRANFKKLVQDHPQFVKAVSEMGAKTIPGRGSRPGMIEFWPATPI